MRKAPIALLFALLVAAIPAQAAEFLVLDGIIPLPAVKGRIDHMGVDRARRRLFVAEYGNNSLDVIDLGSGQRVRQVSGLDHPQGIGYSAGKDTLAISSGGNGTVRLYRGRDLEPAGTIALGHDADNLRVAPATGNLIVAYGEGGLAVIDPASGHESAKIRLPDHPEAFQIDPASRRIFVNVPAAGEIAVLDLAEAKQIARWTVPGLHGNFPMAFDEADRLLAVVFRRPPRLVLLDAATGAEITALPTCADADDAWFDARRRRIYVSCGAGAIAVFQRDAGSYRASGRVATARGARTSLFVSDLDRLYVAAPAVSPGITARILVFRPLP